MPNDTKSPAVFRPAHNARRFRLPGIEREGMAQLTLLETALWPVRGGVLSDHTHRTQFNFIAPSGSVTAEVTVRAPLGLHVADECVLWGLLGATLNKSEGDAALLATPAWMIKHLGLDRGGTQYQQLRDALTRLAVVSYQNTAFYNPLSKEREHVLFQFLSYRLPTVDGVGESLDYDRAWRVEWNPTFFSFVKSSGGSLLFDLDMYRSLSPSARRLFLKLQDRFWRKKSVYFNVDDLTIHGLGFSAERPLAKRKYDLLAAVQELLDHRIITISAGQTRVEQLVTKRGVGSYVIAFHEGEYFRKPVSPRTADRNQSLEDDPLFEPLRTIGVDAPAVRRLLEAGNRQHLQRWIRITDAALHEQPRGFSGFRTSAAAYLIDGVQNHRTPPDWYFAHEKRVEEQQWRNKKKGDDSHRRMAYEAARDRALQEFLASEEGSRLYQESLPVLLSVAEKQEPHRAQDAAREAARKRLEKLYFQFPDFADWEPKLADASLCHANS